jgi:methylenetetrahydrofolate reductase (NADPH)
MTEVPMDLGRATELSAELGLSKETIISFAEGASLEVAMPSAADIEVLALHLRTGTEVFLSDVPRRSGSDLIESCARLAAAGLAPVPHVAVRRVKCASLFERLLSECVEFGGARKAMLIAGDQTVPGGPFVDVASALLNSDLRRCGIDGVAVAAYPDGHPLVPTETLEQALAAKLALLGEQGLKRQIVTQFGFDSQAVGGWLARLRQTGVPDLVSIGMAGPATLSSLTKFALRCGVRTTTRGLLRDSSRVGGLIANQPERLMGLFAAIAGEPGRGPAKAHFFTFGGIAKTARWVSALGSGRFAIVDGAIRLDSSIA